MDSVKLILVICLFIMTHRASATTTCSIEDVSECTYTVTCMYHPGSASNPHCHGEPNVTFVLTSTIADNITTGFFGATNFDSRVRYIRAKNNIWYTLGKQGFSYFSNCKYMELTNNHIIQIQRESFKLLIHLRYLNLSHNELNHLEAESFKISDTTPNKIEILDLSYNKLTHLTDEVLSELSGLNELYLNGNSLKSLSDNCFSGFKFLKSLYLQHNDLETLNITLVKLKYLVNLDVSYNHLVNLAGYEINRLQNLEALNVSHNEIESVESNCFIHSTNLLKIDFSFNAIKSKIDGLMFGSNTKLEYLDFYSNRISIMEDECFNKNNLSYLNVQKNNINGEITNKTFVGLKNVTILDFSGQNITTLKNNAFVEMIHLITLNISQNYITNIENYTFIDSSLLVLDLSFNQIYNLNFLRDCLNKVTEIYLRSNKITIIEENTFAKQTHLIKLDISSNKILTIDENALPFMNVQYLNIQNNSLTGNINARTFSPARNLRALDLSYHSLSKINHQAFIDMPVLARLNLSHNVIKSIENDNFDNMSNMYSLDLSYNKLQTLQFNNSILKSLKSIYLNNNKFVNITGVFPENCKLIYLDMTHNGIWDLFNVNFKIFPALQVLHLSYNNIENFNNFDTNSLTNLVDLRLSSNKIANINLSYFKELLIVDLRNNSLNYINNTFFQNIDFLQSLDLSSNKLKDLPPGTFQNMRNLKLLNLSSNIITKLRYGSLKGLHKTELLDISNNKIDSLDVHIFHECTELKTLIIDYNRIKTIDIEKLVVVTQRKLRTLSLGGNPISCQEIIRNTTVRDLTYYGLIPSQIEITSIDKIYHEDNVHGIKCGDDTSTNEMTTVAVETEVKGGGSSSAVIIAWCSILTIVVIAVGVGFYQKFRKQNDVIAIYRDSRMTLRSSLEMNSSEYQNDLLN